MSDPFAVCTAREACPDFVNAPPKSRLGHPTFRLITIYNSVLGICYLHCR